MTGWEIAVAALAGMAAWTAAALPAAVVVGRTIRNRDRRQP